MGALVLAGAVLLVPYAIDNAGLQRTDHTSDHAAFFHWVETSFTAAGIVLVGTGGRPRPHAFRMATWCAGLALATRGGSVTVQSACLSACLALELGRLVGGLAFIGLGEWEARRPSRDPPGRPSG